MSCSNGGRTSSPETFVDPIKTVFGDPRPINGTRSVLSPGIQRLDVHDTIRMRHYPTTGGYRVWKVEAVLLGATYQESTYRLRPLDIDDHETIQVPCLMLETHPGIEKV